MPGSLVTQTFAFGFDWLMSIAQQRSHSQTQPCKYAFVYIFYIYMYIIYICICVLIHIYTYICIFPYKERRRGKRERDSLFRPYTEFSLLRRGMAFSMASQEALEQLIRLNWAWVLHMTQNLTWGLGLSSYETLRAHVGLDQLIRV